MLAVFGKFPSRVFVLHRSIVMLKLRIALLAGLVLAAIGIEALNRTPGPIRRCLTSLRVETTSKRVLMGKFGAIALQVILRGMLVHPQAQALIADELRGTNGLLNGRVLLRTSVQL